MNRIIWIFLIFQFLFGQVTVPDKPNPHTDSSCESCHSQSPPSLSNVIQGSCESCHMTQDVELHHKHPVYGKVSVNSLIKIPEILPMDGENLSCKTCHTMECESPFKEKDLLRKSIFMTETDFCYQCHDRSQYQAVSPHVQYTSDSIMIEESCIECHGSIPDVNGHMNSIREAVYHNSSLCIKCHQNPNHEKVHMNKKIDSKNPVFKAYLKSISKHDKLLPLNASNRIGCFTCHYSHEYGISLEQQVIYDHGKSNDNFLRLPQVKTCMACHEI